MEVGSTPAVVLEVLQSASSQNAEILKPAESKLMEWETQPGFYSVLFNVISNHSIVVNVRWIAILYMKNGIDKYWRSNCPNAISPQEKQQLRQGLIATFNEPVNHIAVQLAVVIAKIARIDYPREWPELLPTLMRAVESSDSLIQHRALLTLHHVVKAVSSKRLAGDRRMFQEFTANVYGYILNLWISFTQAFLRDMMQNASAELIVVNLEKALLTLRILRKLTVYGFHKPHQNQACNYFMKIIFEHAKTTLECRKRLSGKGIYLLELCEKFIIHLTKIMLLLLDTHPFSYVDLIQPTLEFTVYYTFTQTGAEFIFERFIIQCFSLINKILLCSEYKPAKVQEMTKEPETLRAHQIKMNFFQPNTLTEMCRKLISHYFILTQDDLNLWESEPETFAIDEVGDNWKYSLRPSMESLFVSLFNEFREVWTPVVLDMIRETNTMVSPNDMQGILKKDAVYNAVGLAAYHLYGELDFDQWFSTTLTQELKVKHNNYRVIRRRIAWLIGNWTGVQLSAELRPALYECIVNLLGSDEDMAVRLAASTALRHAIDDFEFSSEQFNPYLDTVCRLLFSLLEEAQECETKMHVLNIMTLLVERMGPVIQPHFDALVHYLPLLWRESEEHNMVRCAIVSTLVQIVKALGSMSVELNAFLIPIIQLGTDVNQSAIVYLLEDTLELWLAVLENSAVMTNDLMQLFNNMPALLEYSSENLRSCLIIVIVHTLLAPELVMRSCGLQIMTICDNLMVDMRAEGIIMLTRVVENYIRVSPALGCETVRPILPRIFRNILEGDNMPMILSWYLSILSRVLLSSHDVFSQTLLRIAQSENVTEENIFSKILDVWLQKMRNVSQTEQRKLLGLALVNLLTTQSRPVLERFGMIMLNVLETLNDITKFDDNGMMSDSLVILQGQSPSDFSDDTERVIETNHDQRKKQLILSDPVHNIVLRDYLQSQMYELKNQLGLSQYELLIRTVDHDDNDTFTQLKEYITF